MFTIETPLLASPYFLKVSLPENLSDLLLQLMALIEVEYHSQNRRSVLEAYMRAFIIHSQSEQGLPNHSKEKNEEKVIRILDLIRKHYKSDKGVDFYAQAVHLSKRRVNEIMVTHTGQTVKQHLINHLVVESKRYMALQSLSSKEIAFHCCFFVWTKVTNLFLWSGYLGTNVHQVRHFVYFDFSIGRYLCI